MYPQEERAEDVLSTPGHLVTVAARGFARLSESRLQPYGLGVGYLPVLIALASGVADTQRDLARWANIKQPPMAQMLARMMRDGLVESVPDPHDGRIARLALTDTARDRMPEAITTLFAGNREAMAGFSEREIADFVGMLQRLIANLNALDSGTG